MVTPCDFSGYLDGKTRIEELRYEDGHDHEFSLENLGKKKIRLITRCCDLPHVPKKLNFQRQMSKVNTIQ